MMKCNVINSSSMTIKHPNIPFYLYDEMGTISCEFGWSLIYESRMKTQMISIVIQSVQESKALFHSMKQPAR